MSSHEDGLRSITHRLSLAELSNKELLQAFAAILEQLRERGISRTSNNPVADYTEWLVCCKLGLELQTNSTAGFARPAAVLFTVIRCLWCLRCAGMSMNASSGQ